MLRVNRVIDVWNFGRFSDIKVQNTYVLLSCFRVIPMNGKITVPLYTKGCEGQSNMVVYLEHVEAKVTLTSSRRGEILIYLTSPMGTRSTLLDKRIRDTSREGFNTWAFMTTHSWGEYAKGTWILEIENGASICKYFLYDIHWLCS